MITLDEARHRGDPVADALIAAFAVPYASLSPHAFVARLVETLHAPTPPTGPLGYWLLEPQVPPSWIDHDLVARGQMVFRRWGLQIGTVLFTGSLPAAYAAAKGVQVLAAASDLSGRHVRLRIAETGQMLVDIADMARQEQGFASESQAVRTVSGVRLLHAGGRHALLASPGWDPEWGVPINQEDLLGTLLSFTTVVIDGLGRLGVTLDADDQEAYLHLWCVVGHFLGIEPELMPQSIAEARAKAAEIKARHHVASPEGIRLTRALVGELELSMPRGLRKVPRTMLRQVAGDEVADLLEVPPSAWWAPALRATARLGEFATTRPMLRTLVELPGRLVARSMFRMYIDAGLRGARPKYRISEEQMKAWRLPTGAARTASRERRVERRRRLDAELG